MIDPLTDTKIQKRWKKMVDGSFKKIPERLKSPVVIFFYVVGPLVFFLSPNFTQPDIPELDSVQFNISAGKNSEQNIYNFSKEESSNETSTGQLLGGEFCFTEGWVNFDPKNDEWSRMSWFNISNRVWSIDTTTKQDVTLQYKKRCLGASLVEIEVIPRLEDFLNINIYLSGLLRWEVGGQDRRSIRLFKNIEGCPSGAIKNVVPLKLGEEFLPNHDEILIDQPTTIHMATFFLPNGLIRNKLWLTYTSKNQNGKQVMLNPKMFYYDFLPGSDCDLDHLPDINQESYGIEIGLQPMSSPSNKNIESISPRVTFDQYKISPYSN